SKKWTWLFQNPARIVAPEQSSTCAPLGARTLPTAVIRPFSINTDPLRIGFAVGLGQIVPPLSTRASADTADVTLNKSSRICRSTLLVSHHESRCCRGVPTHRIRCRNEFLA